MHPLELASRTKRLSAFAAAAWLFAPLAAVAQDSDAARLADELQNPATQEQLAAMAEAMAGAVLDVPVAPLLRAAAQVAGEDPESVDPDATVGDLAGPEAAEAPREFARRLPQMMGAMAALAVALEDMLPRLAEIGESARRTADESK